MVWSRGAMALDVKAADTDQLAHRLASSPEE
jgi:hypothetical protein